MPGVTETSPMASPWRLVSRCRGNGLVEVRKYVSEASGLRLTVADAAGPMVSAHLVLATETHTDEGLPHTLEHLVFMGSKRYPYKGVLDLLANRCLASGTNAWTATDHTAYTLATAGQEGFLKLLPIYLDHVLQPMLTESQFLTEVHHVTGKGTNAGVVYCEMQEHETKMSEMTSRELSCALYPEDSGYRYETGGRLEPLRVSTSIERVRAFHEHFYRPENLNVIVTGPVDEAKLMEAIRPVEEDILKKAKSGGRIVRPWRSPIEAMEESSEKRVRCPVDDASKGMVLIGWRGPPVTAIEEVMGVTILLEYLTDTAVSPCEQRFIQIPQPLASSISGSLEENWVTAISFEFNGVPKDQLLSIKSTMMETLGDILGDRLSLDMSRMGDILAQAILRSYSKMETECQDTLSHMILGDFLYGENETEFEQRMNDVAMYKQLKTKESSFWTGLLHKYMNPAGPHATIVGEPSVEAVEEFGAAEKLRIAQQKEKMGPDGLKAAAKRLKEAVKENEGSEPPVELVQATVVNSLDGIQYVKLTPSSSLSIDADSNPHFRLSHLPFTTMLDHVNSNFVKMTAVMDTSGLGVELRSLLLLWQSLLWESGMEGADGAVEPFENVVKELNRDLVDYSANIGIGGNFHRLATLSVKIDVENYGKGVWWLERLLSSVAFEPERVAIVAKKLANSAASQKRDGDRVARFLLSHLIFEKGSNPYIAPLIRQEKLMEKMAADPGSVVARLKTLRSELRKASCFSLHLACDPEKLKLPDGQDPPALLKTLVTEGDDSSKCRFGAEPLYHALGSRRALIASVGSCEASHVLRVSAALRDCESPELGPLMLFLQYLSQCEGPLWCEIRGKGLAYGANIYAKPEAGLVYLSLYRSTDPLAAYKETKAIVEAHLDGTTPLDPDEFEGAKRSLVFEVIEREDSVAAAAHQSLLGYFRGVRPGYNDRLCRAIWDTDAAAAVAAGKAWLPQLFDPAAPTATAVTTHPNNVNGLVAGFAGIGEQLELVTLEDSELSWDVPL